MPTAIRNLIGAALLILTVGMSSCLALTGSGAGAAEPTASASPP